MTATLDSYTEIGADAADEATRLPLERLEAEISTLAADLWAATCRWLLLVGEFDRREGWAGWGVQSCAHWLSWRCGVSLVTAREHVRVGRALGDLPAIREAFARGKLSYSKVRALVRVATAESDADLCELALQGTAAQLERMLAVYHRVTRSQAQDRHARRFLRLDWDSDGSLLVRGRLSPEDGAQLVAALELAEHAGRDSAESSTRPSRADALVVMAETTLAHGPTPAPGGDRTQMVVHVDAVALAGTGTGRCHVEDGPVLAPETARRLACDAAVVPITTDGDGTPLSVGRKTRTVPASMRRALRARDAGCRYPGCGERRWVDAHHVHHWARGGPTSLDNLVLLCRRHHRLVHEDGFGLDLLEGRWVCVRRPDGTAVPEHDSAESSTGDVVDRNRRIGIRPGPRTATALDGGPMDLDLAVGAVFQIVERAN